MDKIGLVLGVLGGLGLIFGIILPILQLKLAPKKDEKLEHLLPLMPGYNCGACGNPGCEGFAKALLEGQVKELKTCKPGSKSKNYPVIIEYLKSLGITDIQ